jgi:nickel transport protein
MSKMMNGRINVMILLAFIVITSTCLPAMAHRITIFAWAEGDTIFTESKFGGGKRVVDSEVLVFDSEGMEILKGRTNERGEFSFKIPKITDLNIVLNAGMGHRAEWRISEAELRGETDVPDKEELQKPSVEKASALSEEDIKQIVEDSVDKKLRPIITRLAETERRPSVTEILGGIGYIFGLMGVAIYFKSRGRRND